MAKSLEKEQAISLRRKGESINQIARKLGISKSTASSWVSNMILTDKQLARLRKNMVVSGGVGRSIGSRVNKERRISNMIEQAKLARQEIGNLTRRDRLLLVIGLFWAEGSKSGSRFLFVNSDPDMVSIMYHFLINNLGIKKDEIDVVIQINRVHELRIKKVLKFWADLLKLPVSHFGNTIFIGIKPKKVYENHDTYYGLVRMRVKKGSLLQYKFLGFIEAIKDQCRSSSVG